ncbi:hypothetical protein CFP56_038495 [Quercus suber]|uniref:Uncharacterized protein n=1 Tax=Quercus suber TaxID=58331 RepID=A0AAW0J241_QUESU
MIRNGKEVEKFVKSSLKEMKNEAGETPYVLFATMHEELRKDGESWMRKTANSSMVINLFEVPKITFVEDRAKAPDVACSENTFLITLASITSPE